MLLKENEGLKIDSKISDFIPVACHYDPETLITKNGDLLKILKITGRELNDNMFNTIELRDLVRASILQYINDPKISIHIHTLNNYSDIRLPSAYNSEIAKNVENRWNQYNNWDNQLVSTLYLTVIIQGSRSSAFNLKSLHKIMLPYFYKKSYLNDMVESASLLNNTVENLANSMSRFGVKVLTINNDLDNKCYSEPLSFLYNLIHLKQKKILLDYCDASNQLSNLEIDYSFNTLTITELDDQESPQIFAAIFSLKPFHDLSVQDCMTILDHSFKYIISESLIFIPKEIAITSIKQNLKFLEAGKSENLMQLCNIQDIVHSESSNKSEYCKKQLSLTLYEENLENLDKSTEKILKVFAEIGVTLTREDFNMPLCFWSNLPGNFRFNTRNNNNLTKLSASFAFVPSASMGSYNGSKWGAPITIFKTTHDLFYYFNFHQGDNGNTMLIGPKSSGKETFIKFLLIQATKNKPKIIFLDLRGENKEFFEAIGGQYVNFSSLENPPIKINLNDINDDENYIKNLFSYLLFEKLNIGTQESESLNKVINGIKTNDSTTNIISNLLENITNEKTKEELKSKLAFLNISAPEDDFSAIVNNDIINIDLSSLNSTHANIIARLVTSKISTFTNNKPTIFVINTDLNVFNKPLPATKFSENFKKISDNNGIVILSCEYNKAVTDNAKFMEDVIKYIPTQIFLPNKTADKSFKKIFKLSEEELYNIRSADRNKRTFLLKQHNKSMNLIFDLNPVEEIKKELI